jgi:hypothetical protein
VQVLFVRIRHGPRGCGRTRRCANGIPAWYCGPREPGSARPVSKSFGVTLRLVPPLISRNEARQTGVAGVANTRVDGTRIRRLPSPLASSFPPPGSFAYETVGPYPWDWRCVAGLPTWPGPPVRSASGAGRFLSQGLPWPCLASATESLKQRSVSKFTSSCFRDRRQGACGVGVGHLLATSSLSQRDHSRPPPSLEKRGRRGAHLRRRPCLGA